MRNRKFVLLSLVTLTSLLGIFSIYFAYNLSEEPAIDVSVAQSCACCVTGSSNDCTGVSGTHVNYGDPLAGSQPECPQAFPIFVGCTETGPVCGNGQIESGEACEGAATTGCTTASGYSGVATCSSCQFGACVSTQYCGDGICSGPETLNNCAADCTNCGDGICSDSENGNTCATDCNTECNDNLDNDGDGDIDCSDSLCIGDDNVCDPTLDAEGISTACDDGIDNDGDGKIDCGGPNGELPDPGCYTDRRGGGTCNPNKNSEIDATLPQTSVDSDNMLYILIGLGLISFGLILVLNKSFSGNNVKFVVSQPSDYPHSYMQVRKKSRLVQQERKEFEEKF